MLAAEITDRNMPEHEKFWEGVVSGLAIAGAAWCFIEFTSIVRSLHVVQAMEAAHAWGAK